MIELDAQTPRRDGGDSTIALFLGLYLVVLAFFIMLVTISSVEESKSSSVMNSLNTTFTTVVPPSAALDPFQSKDGEIVAGQEYQEQVTKIFSTSLAVAKVEVVQPGRLMRVTFEPAQLFYDDEVRIRETADALLDQIVATVSSRRAGLRNDLEFVINTPNEPGKKTMSTKQTLNMARAGSFAREMSSRGLPPDSLAVGLRPNRSSQIVMWFYTRDVEETRLDFDGPPANGNDSAAPQDGPAPQDGEAR